MTGDDLWVPTDDADAVLAWLAEHLRVEVGPGLQTTRVALDTFDGRVHRAGLTAGFELAATPGTDVLAVAERDGTPVGVAALPRRPVVRIGDLEAGPLRDRLAPLLQERALLAGAEVRTRARSVRVLNDDDKTVVRIWVLEPVASPAGPRPVPAGAAAEGGAPVALRLRVRVAGVRGYERARATTLARLVEGLGASVAEGSLDEEGLGAVGIDPAGVRPSLEVGLEPSTPAATALALVLGRLIATVEANRAGTVADWDTEFLHDLRVAVRRARTVLRNLPGVADEDDLHWWRSELRWLQEVTGPTRDLDVHLDDVGNYRRWVPDSLSGALDPLGELLTERRQAAFDQMVDALGSQRYRDLVDELGDWLEQVRVRGPGAGPEAGEPVGAMVGRRIRKVHRRIVDQGARIDDHSPGEAFHDLRKRGKELRYLLEVFGPCYDADAVRSTVKQLKALQDVLGRHQDRAVQLDALVGLGPELAGRERGAESLMALGSVVERLVEDQHEARARFGEAFAAFATPERRRLVRRTFR